MVIQKKDLVKQFELVVKQEIINHNEQIAQTNRAINELKKDVESLLNSRALDFASLTNSIKSVDSKISKLEKEFDQTIEKITSNTNDQLKFIQREIKLSKELIDKINSSYVPREIYKLNIDELYKRGQEINQLISLVNIGVEAKINQTYCKFNENLTSHKKDMSLKPNDIKLLRDEIYKNLDAIGVNISGIKDELENQKKKQFILEKEKERLNTLLERLKYKGS